MPIVTDLNFASDFAMDTDSFVSLHLEEQYLPPMISFLAVST